MTQLAIFASGTGSNAKKILEQFQNHSQISIGLVLTNKAGAGVIAVAQQFGVKSLVINKERFFEGDGYVDFLRNEKIDFIVLAGFLLKIPSTLIKAYPEKIINIHPALLPNYGGKGMFGMNVHKAVLENKDPESGITIHYVDEQYDHGATIFQTKCPVYADDSPETLASRVQQLEHLHFPAIVEETVNLQMSR